VLSHWEAAITDPFYASVDGRFESNSFGKIIVSPPPPYGHAKCGFLIAELLKRLLGGEAATECPVLTIDGVRSADAVWMTSERDAKAHGQAALSPAPQICVEVISPANSEAEMEHKRSLYFDAGAEESWTCDEAGMMRFYFKAEPNKEKIQSKLCPDFPPQMKR
jgi:Uma2 family endonuclease